MLSTPIVPLAEAHLDAAAATLAAAFDDYAWTRWVVPEENYEARLGELQRLYLAHARQHGIALCSEGAAGVIALLPSDAPPPAEAVLARIAELHGERLDRLGERGPAAGDWTLETVGVDPGVRGRGLGGRLVEAGLEAVRARGCGSVVLETSDERNVALYRRHGFDVTSHIVSATGPEVWTMRRDLR
ncbi:GNAT family N-acetyltransferase [Brevibacterium album]|uniref:GNAT family N-acetyltransferase n=1 Tax=Brevibacterium album TaxID=417948 RepID=UPI00040F43D7|nr:GNAT family N-acetyltransferase [Brevibacterium album]